MIITKSYRQRFCNLFLAINPKLVHGFLCCLSIANLSMTWQESEGIVTEEDMRLEKSQDVPAISSIPGEASVWESYNRWVCLPADSIELSCVTHFFKNGDKTEEPQTPSILIEREAEKMEFDYDDYTVDCDAVISEWESLLENESSICIYAAHLQDFDAGHSYWLLEQLKTTKGYWLSNRAAQPTWVSHP